MGWRIVVCRCGHDVVVFTAFRPYNGFCDIIIKRIEVSMARKGLVQNNILRHKLVVRFAERRKGLALAIKKAEDLETKLQLIKQLDGLPRNSSPTRYRNRCSITGRARGYSKFTGLCRTATRRAIAERTLPGFIKGRTRG